MIQLCPKIAPAYAGRGEVFYKKGDYDRAIADITQAIQLDPKDAKVYDSRGDVYSKKGESDRAIVDYTQAIQLDPKNTKAYVGHGIAYQNKGDNARAIADFTQAIQLDPKFAHGAGVDQRLALLQKSTPIAQPAAQPALTDQEQLESQGKRDIHGFRLGMTKMDVEAAGGKCDPYWDRYRSCSAEKDGRLYLRFQEYAESKLVWLILKVSRISRNAAVASSLVGRYMTAKERGRRALATYNVPSFFAFKM